MFRKIYERIREYMVSFDNEPGGGLHNRLRDKRDYVFSSIFGYTPKHTSVDFSSKVVRIHNQYIQSTCVLESGTAQKEPDEGVELSVVMPAAYLKKNGLMSKTGTSLSVWQKFLYDVGVCRRNLITEKYQSSWEEFADQRVLSQEVMDDGAKHKSGSFGVTFDLTTVVRKLDEALEAGKWILLQTGADWYSGYNMSGGLRNPWILEYAKGIYRAGHAFMIVGYILNYHGHDVLKCANSYGKEWGDNGYFYIKFSDFQKMFGKYGVYFNSDVPKSIAGWTSIYNGRAVQEINGPRVYILEAGKKRHIPDEAIMWMLGITPQNIVTDEDNNLSQVPEGEPISVKEFTPQQIDQVRYFVSMQKDDNFMKDRFSKYFPELFTK